MALLPLLTFEISVDDLDDQQIIYFVVPFTFLPALFVQCGLDWCNQPVFFEEIEVCHNLANYLEPYVRGSSESASQLCNRLCVEGFSSAHLYSSCAISSNAKPSWHLKHKALPRTREVWADDMGSCGCNEGVPMPRRAGPLHSGGQC